MGSEDNKRRVQLNNAQLIQLLSSGTTQRSAIFKGHEAHVPRQRRSRSWARRKAWRQLAEQKRCRGERAEKGKNIGQPGR